MSFLQTVQNPMCIIINHVILLKKCICITVYIISYWTIFYGVDLRYRHSILFCMVSCSLITLFFSALLSLIIVFKWLMSNKLIVIVIVIRDYYIKDNIVYRLVLFLQIDVDSIITIFDNRE